MIKKIEDIKIEGINLDEDKEIHFKGGKFIVKSGALLKVLDSDHNKVECWDGKVWNNIGI